MEPAPGTSSTVPGSGGGVAGSITSTIGGGGGSAVGGTAGGGVVTRPPVTALFREIHKNTWLRRLNGDSRRPSVLNKKPDRYWVVFCVHDDCEAFLEGYSDPRHAPSHAPEWSLSLQTVQHISHALVSVEQEFEFVITLGSEVARFNANTWECMQEWVDCLRSKLREMKLLSPRENLYSRLPEVRAPLAPTRDPTSPLPATPPVPAAIVPGIERVQPASQQQHHHIHPAGTSGHSGPSSFPVTGATGGAAALQPASLPLALASNGSSSNTGTTSSTFSSSSSASSSSSSLSASSSSSGSYSSTLTSISSCPNGGASSGPPAMSNTSTQNLMNLLSNPLQAVSSISQGQGKPQPDNVSLVSCSSGSSCASASDAPEDLPTTEDLLKRTATVCPSGLPKPQKMLTRENGHGSGGGSAVAAHQHHQQHHHPHHNQQPVVTVASGSSMATAVTSSLATTFVNNVLADPSGAAGASLKRTSADKLLLDVRCDGDGEDDNKRDHRGGVVEALPAALRNGTPEGDEARPTPSQRQRLQHAPENTQNGAATTTSSSESTTSSTTFFAAGALLVDGVGMQPSSSPPAHAKTAICCIVPASTTGEAARVEPKRARRKISPLAMQSVSPTRTYDDHPANVTIIQVSNSSIAATPSPTITTSPKPVSRFIFTKAKPTTISTAAIITDNDDCGAELADNNYKSNVQIIPSNVEYDRQQHGHVRSSGSRGVSEEHPMQPSIIASINEQQITTVTVPNVPKAVQFPAPAATPATVQVAVATSSTPIKGPENNFGTVTQIAVNSGPNSKPAPQHYEQVFLSTSSSSSSVQVTTGSGRSGVGSSTAAPVVSGTPVCSKPVGNKSSKVLLLSRQPRSSSHSEIPLAGRPATKGGVSDKENHAHVGSIIHGVGTASTSKQQAGILPPVSSPAVLPLHLAGGSPSKRPAVDRNIYTPHPQRAPLLQRGLTELVLSTRATPSGGGPVEHPAGIGGRSRRPPVENKIRNEYLPPEQRRRSSSTSDARQENPTRSNGSTGPSASGAIGRLQSPPQPFRPHHQLINVPEGQLTNGGGGNSGPIGAGGNRKLTLREQQVFQLRREMMHPGGVRLQLRRKDCINSIGLVDAFGGVWVAGWKQKEHPVLYNALHIGDQLISVAGAAIASAADAHKAIRAAPGLFVELIIRRVPFGRVYAVRREIDGQCLGLIRDGNTATIVDVVPNSLAARHGLPPKAKACDGLSLTFWVLTEINGRPLNLFFKENEIRDRLNAVGRDISILVQPADLVTKLKKQLKSLRGHKDFIVQ